MDDGIRILKKAQPGMCGGTDATLDEKAPHEIDSHEMYFFMAESRLILPSFGMGAPTVSPARGERPLSGVSAFAARAGKRSFLFLTLDRGRGTEERESSWALVEEDVFRELDELVRREKIAKSNGFHSVTHGLPMNFGGSVEIRYESGERISFSNNQSPVLSYGTGAAIVELFKNKMKGPKAVLPELSTLVSIRFSEQREDGYKKAVLTINEDGTGVNEKVSKYEDGNEYRSVKPVEKEAVSAILEGMKNSGILAWADLPERAYLRENKTLVFTFSGGEEITVHSGKETPGELCGGFFNIELELSVKH